MRDRIISNVLIKMGNRIKKKELDYLENVLVEEFRDVQIKKESTELTEYNDSLRKDVYKRQSRNRGLSCRCVGT